MILKNISKAALSALLIAGSLAAHAQGAVQALADDWMEAYNKLDRAALGDLYTPNARLMMHGSPTITGRDRIEEFWAADFEVGNPLTLMDVTHSVVGTDMVLVHGDYRVVNRDNGARLGFGRFAHIWVRDGDREWRLDRDLWQQRFEPVEPRY